MSVPLNHSEDTWAVLLNDCHTIERQRVTLMEEYWHILLGHKLTKIARVADGYGQWAQRIKPRHKTATARSTMFLMAGRLNRVELVGRLARDPEIRSNQDGTKRVMLSLATSDHWTRQGER